MTKPPSIVRPRRRAWPARPANTQTVPLELESEPTLPWPLESHDDLAHDGWQSIRPRRQVPVHSDDTADAA